jgi:NTP pyrophosphatase (non-canonical NTP hydrolase)
MIDKDIGELQKYIWQKNIDRGFSEESAERKMLMLTEEVGELAKAGLASTLKIDIFEALEQKEAKNAKRKWS